MEISGLVAFFKKNKRYIYLEYAVLTLLILWPLLKSGYVFAVDMPWSVNFSFPQIVDQNFLLKVFFWGINKLIPSWLIQKIVLFLTFFFAGIGAHKLIKSKYQWPKYFAGLLYLFTPFFYSRFLYGQIFLLVAYAIMPFLVKRLLLFFDKQNWKNLLWLVFLFCLISLFALQYLFFAWLFFVVCFAVYLGRFLLKKNFKKAKRLLLFSCFCVFVFFVLNSYWLMPFVQGHSNKAQDIQQFNIEHQQVFQTDNGGGNVFFNVLGMYGFWGDRSEWYVLPKDVVLGSWVIFLIIFGVVVWGAIATKYKSLQNYEKNKKEKIIIFTIIGIVSVFLAVGSASEFLKPVVEFLNKYVPFYKGFREPQKFVGLLVLSYCYLGSQGLIDLSQRLRKYKKEGLIALFCLLPILYNPLMFNGFKGQMFVSQYPDSWYQTNQFLNQDQQDFQVLFLPWHQYMSFGFAQDKLVGNLGCRFFDKPVVCGDNMELGGIYTASQRPFSNFFESEVLDKKKQVKDLGEKLKFWNVKYILLAKEVDWQDYDFLNLQLDLKLVKEYNDILVYENLSY